MNPTRKLFLAACLLTICIPWAGAAPTTDTTHRRPPTHPVVTPKLDNPTAGTSASASATTLPLFTSKAVMVGQQVPWFADNRKALPSDILSSASRILSLDLRDATVVDEHAASTLARADAALAGRPSVVIITSGAADETSGTNEAAFRDAITALARKAAQASPAVFIVPSSTELGAGMIAALREASIAAGVQFVETGSKFEGTPYFDALREITRLRTGQAPAPTTTAEAQPTPIPVPAVAMQPIAGETTISGQLAISIPAGPLSIDEPSPADEAEGSGPLTVRSGAAPTPVTGEYNPPPALKRVDPKVRRPVPRTSKLKRPSVEE